MKRTHLLSFVLPATAVAVLGSSFIALRPSAAGEDVATKKLPVAVAFAQEKAEKQALPAGTGILKGKITFKGEAPKLPPIVKMGDPSVKDAPVCAANAIPDESLVVNGGAVQNVVIYMQKAPSGYKAPPVPSEPAVFDQKNCQFVPHVMTVRVDQVILVKSGDPIAHNTHTSPFSSREFNSAIGANERDGVKLTYNKAERLPVNVKCDLHPWMKAYHVVTDHPFAVVTDKNGEFEIIGIPAGSHDFTIWHERPGYLERKKTVKIQAGKTTELNLEFDAKKFKL